MIEIGLNNQTCTLIIAGIILIWLGVWIKTMLDDMDRITGM